MTGSAPKASMTPIAQVDRGEAYSSTGDATDVMIPRGIWGRENTESIQEHIFIYFISFGRGFLCTLSQGLRE